MVAMVMMMMMMLIHERLHVGSCQSVSTLEEVTGSTKGIDNAGFAQQLVKYLHHRHLQSFSGLVR